ncbi:ankyrin repeat-containing domain protein [Baffinella frigidus]|nr:ankyrin repeat-containing domain protein [Cryptophyta sp. CCMP2293]
MKREHSMRGDSKVTFSPGNYDTTTTPEAEWRVVTDPEEGKRVSVGKRVVQALAELRQDSMVQEAGLLDEEILALVLYTGPMFSKYNAVLRGFPKAVVDDLNGNTYATTIHLIVSGVIKLSRRTVLPKDRVVYRGLGDLELPEEFLKEDRFGVRGGVEFGLMSTTEDLRVAVQYAGTKMPTVFRISVGAVDRGASLERLSQYRGEKEILYPPMSYLEVTGETRMEAGPGGKVTRVVSLSVNANQTCGTIEDMLGSRRGLHVAMLENYALEIEGELQARLESPEVKQRLAHDASAEFQTHHLRMVKAIMKEVGRVVNNHKSRDAEWYNEDDAQYDSATREAMQLKKMALGKFEHWMEGAHAGDLETKPMHAVRRQVLAQLHRRLTHAHARDLDGAGAVQALELCKELGLLVKSVGETNEEGEPPLVAAGSGGNVWALELLLAAGCDVGSAKDGWSALHWASMLGHKGSVACLVEAGADVHAKTDAGETSLTVAARAGQSELVKYLAEKGGEELLMLTTENGASCAYIASQNGHTEALGVLIEAGGKELLMLTDEDGASCAYIASGSGHVGALRVLIQAGGKELLMLTTEKGRSCAYTASENGHVETLRVLIGAGGKELLMRTTENGMSCAWVASQNGHAEALRVLFEAGGKELLMLTNTNGKSCALMSSEYGHVEALGVLIEAGGKELVMLTNNKGESCLSVAVLRGHMPMVESLLQCGGRELVLLLGASEMSCLHFAAAGGDEEAATALAEMLVTAGGEKLLEQADSRLGWTPLHNAVYAGHSLLVAKMLEWMDKSGDVEEVKRSIEALEEANLKVFRGVPQMAPVDSREGVLEFFEFCTVRSSKGCRAGCKCYYEITILRVDECPQIGFAASGFECVRTQCDDGVGDDDQSWGVDGTRQLLWPGGGGGKYRAKWQEGDVVGLACDLARGQILVSVNGSFEAPNGVVFERAGGFEGEMFAAITGKTGWMRYNLGDTPFAHAPPAPEFEAFCSLTAP